MAPYPLMDQVTEPGGKQRLILYLFLHRHGHGAREGCWASVRTLAAETGINRDDVCLALRWLVENGWAERETRVGKPSRYWLKADAPTHQKVATPQKVGTHQKVTPPTHQKVTPTYPPKGDTNKNPYNKNPEQEPLEEPPCIPPAAAVTKPRRATSAKDRYASRVLPADAVPSDLLDCQQLLPEWWSVKGKGRTETAFNRACGFLRQYTADERRQILNAAIIGGHQGLFPPRDGPRAHTTYQPRKSQTSQAVDNVLAFFDANPHLA